MNLCGIESIYPYHLSVSVLFLWQPHTANLPYPERWVLCLEENLIDSQLGSQTEDVEGRCALEIDKTDLVFSAVGSLANPVDRRSVKLVVGNDVLAGDVRQLLLFRYAPVISELLEVVGLNVVCVENLNGRVDSVTAFRCCRKHCFGDGVVL